MQVDFHRFQRLMMLVFAAAIGMPEVAWAQTGGRPVTQDGRHRPTASQHRLARVTPVAPRVPHAAGAPFQLTARQQARVDQVLDLWEKESAKVRTFRCPFERLEYDPVFLAGGDKIPVTKSHGQIKYAKPDKGLFRIDDIARYDAKKGSWENSDEPGEYWVCDGKAIFEFNTPKKQLIVRQLPPELQGKAIADGPLPFLFSADARKLKRRYFIRITNITDDQIWLEAFPRFQRDAANYREVELILDRERFLPAALQVHEPNGKNRTVYLFHLTQAKVNDALERFIGVFQQPRTPLGWKKVVEPAQRAAPPSRAARRRPAATPLRQR